MKKIISISIVLLSLHFAGYNTAGAQNEDNPPLEQYSYLVSKGSMIIVTMDNGAVNFDPGRIAMVLPGIHTFDVLLRTVTKGSTMGSQASSGNVSVGMSFSMPDAVSYSAPLSVDHIFEAGKYYAFDYKKTHKGIFKSLNVPDSIVEITDYKTIEKTKKILEKEKGIILSSDWSKTNPGALEGSYKTQNGKAEITFSGDTFHLSLPSLIKSPYVYDGTFYFDEKMITLKANYIKTGKSERKPCNLVMFLNYQLNNGVLNTTLPENIMTTPPSINNRFYSSIVTEASGNNNIENTAMDTVIADAVSNVLKSAPSSLASLEGNYKTEKNKKQISFKGNTFHLSLPALIGHYVYDGTFSYNGETISLYIDSYKSNGIHLHTRINIALSYMLDGGLLDIFDVKNIDGGTTAAISSAKGEYYKSSE